MNIDNLTIGEVKQLAGLFSEQNNKSSFLKNYIGMYVICRSLNEGVNFGKVVEIDETGVVLEECRRLYWHKPKETKSSWYEGVANYGLSHNSQISDFTTKVIVENYSLTLCKEKAIESIKSHETYEQS